MTDKPGHSVSVSSSASSQITHSSGGPIDPSGAKAARAEVTTVGIPAEYKVVDQPWQPDDPAITEAMLTEIGLDGWRLVTVYPDPQREKSRWIFSR